MPLRLFIKGSIFMAEQYNDTRTGATAGGAREYDTPRKGFPWWILLLLALIVLALLYALFHHKTAVAPTPAVVATPVTQPAQTPTPVAAPMDQPSTSTSTSTTSPTAGQDVSVHKGTDIATAKAGEASVQGEPLTDVAPFAAAADKTTFIGRKVKLTNVAVVQVISDRAFYVGAGAQQQMLVLLDKGMDAGASGHKITIQNGAVLSLTGIVEAVPTAEILNQQYQITGDNAAGLLKQTAYLHATVAQAKS